MLTTLHSFTGNPYGHDNDGANPNGALVRGIDGNIYGTTNGGGSYNDGTVFEITPTGAFTTLHSFTGFADGAAPQAGLVQGNDGNLYGTTGAGGSGSNGTFFQITPAGVITTLHSFTGGADSGPFYQNLALGSDGNFYGISGQGAFFQITPAGVPTTLSSASATNSGGLEVNTTQLVLGSDGNFYGTTSNYGGDPGAFFKITSTGVFTLLYSFPHPAGTDGQFFNPFVQGNDGAFYSTTVYGGSNDDGICLRITPAGTFTLLYNFTGSPFVAGSTTDGAFPEAALVQGSDGNFYGTTYGGGSNGDGTVFRLSRTAGAPMVTVQPTSQIVTAGQAVALSASASGALPLSYQWRLNGVNISGATNATLAILNAQQTNSGSYSVVVSNGIAPAAVSQESKLTVYAPPTGQQSAAPTQSTTSQPLSAAQTQKPRATASSQLKILNSTAVIEPTRMTIVMTHGLNSSAAAWPASMGNAFKATFDRNVNILAWDWSADAATASSGPLNAAYAASRAPNQGRALGQALIAALGAGYNLPIHFIGSDLGTLVNCEAANYIQGDNRSLGDATPTFSAANFQMTMLDEAGNLVNSLLGKSDGDLLIFNGNTSASQAVINRWANAIPDRSAWVDNYISAPGYLQSKAANVLLFRNALSASQSAGYASSWYQETVSAQLGSMGDTISFERGTLTTSQPAPPEDTFSLQSSDANSSDQLVTPISQAPASDFELGGGGIILPAAAYDPLYASGSLEQNIVSSAIQYSDNLAVNIIQSVEPVTGAPVYLGGSSSTPAYLTVPGYPSQITNQAVYGMQLTMQPPASANAVYAIIPVTIPNEAVGVSFEYQMTGAADSDFMTMGVAAENDFTMEGAYVTSGTWNGAPLISVSSYHGQSTQLVFAMSGSNGPPSGTLSVRNIKFIIPPRPQLSLAMNGTSLTVSWPVNATDWTLQTTATLSDPNSWQTVSGAPVDTTLAHTMTLNVASKSQFFRLLK